MRDHSSVGYRKMKKVKNALFLLVVLIIPFICVEILARIFIPQPILMYIPSKNFRLIYELNPLYPQTSSLGMRQEEFDLSTPHDYFVIAVIGDSHTFSIGSAKLEDSFPARLEHHLTSLTGNNIKVLNFGVPGYNMAQELEVLRAKTLPFKPDLVILQYTINDEHISNFIQPKYGWLNRAFHQSLFLKSAWNKLIYSGFGQRHVKVYVEEYLPDLLLFTPGLVGTPMAQEKDPAHTGHPPRSKDQVPARYHDFIGRENLERDVKRFGEVCEKAGVPALATGFIEDQDRTLYEASGFQVYTFFKIFHGLDMRDYGYDPAHTSGHFSEQGSDLIGKALAVYVSAKFDLSKK